MCSQCFSILFAGAKHCAACHTYRFWWNADAVIFAADLAAQSPFPLTGTVPRYDDEPVWKYTTKKEAWNP